jgi:signal transduction histidine kinase
MAYLLFTQLISAAMRYGYGPALAMTLIFVLADAVESLLDFQSFDAAFAFRSGFLCITALLASYLRSLTVKAEMALHDRLVELQRLYADLAIVHQELLSLDEAKTNFLANVSHELRTPLTSIRAFSELLQSYPDNEETQQEFLQIITSESERLTRLVNDVLDISRIEAGHMDWKMGSIDTAELLRDLGRTFAPLVELAQLTFEVDIDVTKIESGQMDFRDELIDVAALLDQCGRTFGPVVEQAGLRFQHHVPRDLARVRGDHDRLQQVVHNLLNNAMKFTVRGTITLRASVMADELRISVSDTGIGIAPTDQARVFEKFQQVGDTLTGKPKGTGLGLTICRDIVAHHGGRLSVESQVGHGSTFTISLPIAAAARRLPAAA